MNITVDKNSHKPIYKQIVDEIIEGVNGRQIKYGSKLPAERELSENLDISRGTVKKAYEALEKEGFVKIIWGSGAFVSKRPDDGEGTQEKEYILSFMNHMEERGYSKREIEAFMTMAALKKFSKRKVMVAAVDCNQEALEIFKKQLSCMPELNCIDFLLSDMESFTNPKALFDNFDIIFTTTSHYDDLVEMLPWHEEKIMKAVVSPDRQTIVNLINMPENTGLLVKTRRFRDIVNNNIASSGRRIPEKDCIFEKWADFESFEKFISQREALIMPPIYALSLRGEVYERLNKFVFDGGRIITFNYMIEKGSIIHIEDRISNILYNFKEW